MLSPRHPMPVLKCYKKSPIDPRPSTPKLIIRIYKMEGTFNDEEMRIIWNSLGLYISRNLRMGRGVNVPKLGIFTFTPPEVRLKVHFVPNRELQIKQNAINSRELQSFLSKKILWRDLTLELRSFIIRTSGQAYGPIVRLEPLVRCL